MFSARQLVEFAMPTAMPLCAWMSPMKSEGLATIIVMWPLTTIGAAVVVAVLLSDGGVDTIFFGVVPCRSVGSTVVVPVDVFAMKVVSIFFGVVLCHEVVAIVAPLDVDGVKAVST